jgi:hypothetical protein
MGTPYALSSDLVSAWPAKSLAVAQYVDGYKLDTGPVQNAQTGTTYTFLLTDTTKTVTANNSAASAYTVPPQSSVVWEAYTVLRILNLGAGVVTLTAGAGVTLTGTVTVAQYASATLTRTGSNAWTISGNASASGMDLITPTSVAGSGVTLSGGQINISAATSVSVNGCFTSAYDNYCVNVAINSGSSSLNLRYRASGTDASSANYDEGGNYGGTSSGNFNVNAGTEHQLYVSSALINDARFLFYSPFLAQPTRFFAEVLQSGNDSNKWRIDCAGNFRPSTQFDGFTLYPGGAGNYTGTMRIYGLRNS